MTDLWPVSSGNVPVGVSMPAPPPCANEAIRRQEENGIAQYYHRGGKSKGYLGAHSSRAESGWKSFHIFSYSELKGRDGCGRTTGP